MANKNTQYRTSPREGGKYYAIESSFDGGKTWHSSGDSAPTLEEANKKIENMNAGLTASGLTQEQAKAEVKDSTPSIGNANPNNKKILTKKEAEAAGIDWRSLPTQYDLDHPVLSGNKKTDANGYIDKDGNVHLNSTYNEARAAALEDDVKNDRDYRTAKVLSQREQDMKNKKFDAKNIDDTYSWSNAELVTERQNARDNKDVELEKALQAEINRRYAAGEAPEFGPSKAKNTNEKTEDKMEVENAEDTGNTERFQVGENTESQDFIGETDKDNGKKKSSYWTNILYGNDRGSVKDNKEAKAEKEKKMDEFLKNNPNLVKAIFSKNSGLNFGERVARLGEMLAMIGSDATRGAYAGFNHQALPDATKGRYSEIYKNAINNQYQRKQDVFESENKANIDKANRVSILKSSPIFAKLDDGLLSQLADNMVSGISEAEWDNYANELRKRNFSDTEIQEMKTKFNQLRDTFSDVTTQRSNVVDLNGKEFDLMRKPQQAIAELQNQKAKLQEQLVKVRTLKYEQLADFMQTFKNTYAGIQSVSKSMSENKEFGYNASTSVRGGIPVISGSVSGGVNGSNGSTSASGTNTDKLALEGLSTGKTTAEEWNKDTATYRKALEASIKEAIKEIDAQISSLKRFHSIDDGIVKAPHMKQWLVREDGTRIALNPDDSIYATKNKLTTKKDKKSEEIIPMEKEDKAVIIQRKLGYNNNGKIVKQTDYYLSKLN